MGRSGCSGKRTGTRARHAGRRARQSDHRAWRADHRHRCEPVTADCPQGEMRRLHMASRATGKGGASVRSRVYDILRLKSGARVRAKSRETPAKPKEARANVSDTPGEATRRCDFAKLGRAWANDNQACAT